MGGRDRHELAAIANGEREIDAMQTMHNVIDHELRHVVCFVCDVTVV